MVGDGLQGCILADNSAWAEGVGKTGAGRGSLPLGPLTYCTLTTIPFVQKLYDTATLQAAADSPLIHHHQTYPDARLDRRETAGTCSDDTTGTANVATELFILHKLLTQRPRTHCLAGRNSRCREFEASCELKLLSIPMPSSPPPPRRYHILHAQTSHATTALLWSIFVS